MKRLKHYLLLTDNNSTTYRLMYEGRMWITDPAHPSMEPYEDYSPVYYYGDIGFEITMTHKLAQDKPTVVISIPCTVLGIEAPERSTEAAAADFFLRAFIPYVGELNDELYNRSRPDNENGKYFFISPGGEIVKRNTAYFAMCPQKDYTNGKGETVCLLNDGVARPPLACLCLRLQVQLPRRNIRKTIRMLCHDLPYAAERFADSYDRVAFQETLELARKQTAVRAWLKESGCCAFIANGSILPRAKNSDLPLPDAIPFRSVPEDEVEVCGVRGMGIRRGVTVITGGGYSGKSTLLDAISAGICDHVCGDGRELCITDDTAVTISAEDGRSVMHVNISPFIKWLPNGDTKDFSTAHASGSTSQAANIMEAVDSGAKLLLIDEDRSATNFMIRDRMMKELIEKEPITPFTDRIRELHSACGVSSILVIGGSGEYLSVADKVYMMEDFRIHDVTGRAKSIGFSNGAGSEPPPADWRQGRILYSERFSSYPEGSGSERLDVSDTGFVIVGDERIDVRGLRDVMSERQLYALGFMLRYLEVSNKDRVVDVDKRISELYERIGEEGVDCVWSGFFTTCERFLDLPRRQELNALIDRMRKVTRHRCEE